MKILGTTAIHATTFNIPTTHLMTDRQARFNFVRQLGGNVLISYLVDRYHQHGPEVHTILDSGVVMIGNAKSKRLITALIARPEQLRRYGITDPKLLALAASNVFNGLNYK